jgi:hypothetical protein
MRGVSDGLALAFALQQRRLLPPKEGTIVNPIAARCRFLLTGAATVAATALLAAPATAATVTSDTSCPDTPVVQPFAAWGDAADYFLAPDGGFEQGGAGWTLLGNAGLQSGNEPFALNAPDDDSSLRLPTGSRATSPLFCISAEHRSLRFVADAAASSSLDVDVIVGEGSTSRRTYPVATVRGSGAWAPSATVPMVVNEVAAAQGSAMNVRLRFTPRGSGGWTIDDVFVDPHRST